MELSVYITTPSREAADKIAMLLVKERFAACANVFPIRSVFLWDGKIRKAKEYAIIAKTKKSLFPLLGKTVKHIHPDAVPCIAAFPIVTGNKKYLEWIRKETK